MTSRSKLATSKPSARKRAALRLFRIRDASGLSQEAVAEKCMLSKRSLGGIERAEHRMTALEVFFDLLDHTIATKGLDAALSAILLERNESVSSRLLGSLVADKPSPAANACIEGWLRPTTCKGGPSATSQSHSAAQSATASRTQQSDLFSLEAAQPASTPRAA